ncbi:2-dehydropantoate 2-reductase (Ketopantoate reductase) (KPA reductase) (KPR) [Tulasnella sp. 408]|nr:2-dehydropantoate 2-reductase (Ketopantoate reductase) (KPA reductase) (KPR) [Tulasnella sp. 408]
MEGVRPNDPVTHPPYGHILSLFITTKAQAAAPAMDALVSANRISPATTIVLMTNGMGVYEQIVESFFKDPETRPQFVLATNTHGASLKRWFDVVHAAKGQINYAVVPDPLGRDQEIDKALRPKFTTNSSSAAPTPSTQQIFSSLHQTVSLLNTLSPRLNTKLETIHHLHHRLILKLITNCCINPLTALKDCKNGDLLRDEDALKTIREICEEAAEVLKRKSADEEEEMVVLAQSESAPSKVNPLPLIRAPSAAELEEEVLRVARLTAENYSSMLQDVRKRKPTEIEYLNGHLTRLAQLYGVVTPANDTLAERLRQKSTQTMQAGVVYSEH